MLFFVLRFCCRYVSEPAYSVATANNQTSVVVVVVGRRKYLVVGRSTFVEAGGGRRAVGVLSCCDPGAYPFDLLKKALFIFMSVTLVTVAGLGSLVNRSFQEW